MTDPVDITYRKLQEAIEEYAEAMAEVQLNIDRELVAEMLGVPRVGSLWDILYNYTKGVDATA